VILLDANILVSAIIGVQMKRVLAEAAARGVTLGVTEPQLLEAARVLTQELGLTREDTEIALEAISTIVVPLGTESYAAAEPAARERLHRRAQADWPVLAAALSVEGGIWSHDRDFFGTGVAVWSSRNMRYAPSADGG
jgi:predicted nucleic acid-binding protein